MKQFLFLIFIISVFTASSCTTFVLQDSNELVFGRNLDWHSDNGIIVVNQRNIKKQSLVFPPEKPFSWTSKYGSITFNQFGKEFPFGGINEKGLVVEVMVVDGIYPKTDNRPAINESQWVQCMLDNCATIEDVIKINKFIRISKISQNLHYLICDRSGKSLVIEFTYQGIQIYRGKELPHSVLENDTYSNSLASYKRKEDCRFTTTVNRIKAYKPTKSSSAVDYSFDLLNEVTLDSSWSIVYDIKNMKIHFKTASFRQKRTIDINQFNFNCTSKSLVFDLKKQTDQKDISKLFKTLTKSINDKILDDAIITNEIDLPKHVIKQIYNYHETCQCVTNNK